MTDSLSRRAMLNRLSAAIALPIGVAGLGPIGAARAMSTSQASRTGVAGGPYQPLWTQYLSRYMTGGGRIKDTANGDISHTEGQGYAMLLAEAFDDLKSFDALWSWTKSSLRRPEDGLYSWRYEAGKGITDPNNASDGEILLAWALMRAARRWGRADYAQESATLRALILRHLVVRWNGMPVILPAVQYFDKDDHLVVNLSYWIFPALQAFAAEDGEPWSAINQSGLSLLNQAVFGPFSLPPDWMALPKPGGSITLAQDMDSLFGFNAVRIPLYLYWGGIVPSSVRGGQGICNFWRQHGERPPATIDVATGELAPYPISQGVRAINSISCGNGPLKHPHIDEDPYYSATLLLLTLVANAEITL
ncbi:MAG: glycosyl hydrolase family 8 [Rhodospirillaceae bacterium]